MLYSLTFSQQIRVVGIVILVAINLLITMAQHNQEIIKMLLPKLNI